MVRMQKFQSTGAVKQYVMSQINFAHSANADTLFEQVISQLIVGRQIGV